MRFARRRMSLVGKPSQERRIGKMPGRSRTAILVESQEHGKSLKRLLPSWKLRTIHVDTSCFPAIVGGEIATMTCAAAYGVSADVVIRADGGADWPLGDAISCRTILSPGDALLVDFADHRDKQARRDTASRRAAYQHRGWVIDEKENGAANQCATAPATESKARR